jgi:predicted  nucleic acid-binding Zn-ribbon protein
LSDIDDLRLRLSVLETEMTEIRERLADTHTLAAHADQDVAEFRDELRAQTRLINITREDMRDLRSEVGDLATEVTARFDQVSGGLEHITRLLEGLAGNES